MNKLKELNEERGSLLSVNEGLLAKENISDEEFRTIEENNSKIEGLDKNIEALAKAESLKAARSVGSIQTESKEEREIKGNYSLHKAIVSLRSGRALEGREAEVQQEAEKEAREAGVSLSGIGIPSSMLETRTDIDQTTSGIQPTQVGAFVDAIRESSVHSKVLPAGSIMNGLTADYKIPVVGKQSVAWATAENSAAADGGTNFSSVTLNPTRLTGYVDISNRVLLQNGQGAMTSVMNDLGREFGQKIDAAMFSTASVTNAPTSIAATSGVGTFTEATYSANASIYSDYIEALQTLADAEGLQGNVSFVGATNLMTDLFKSSQVASVTGATGTNFGNAMPIAGYPSYFTTAATSSAGVSGDFIVGDFSKVKLGFFGGLDLTIDPYSALLNDQVRLVAHRHLDFALVQGAAFVKATSLVA
jgi:HK97 family phage major capsid protein